MYIFILFIFQNNLVNSSFFCVVKLFSPTFFFFDHHHSLLYCENWENLNCSINILIKNSCIVNWNKISYTSFTVYWVVQMCDDKKIRNSIVFFLYNLISKHFFSQFPSLVRSIYFHFILYVYKIHIKNLRKSSFYFIYYLRNVL